MRTGAPFLRQHSSVRDRSSGASREGRQGTPESAEGAEPLDRHSVPRRFGRHPAAETFRAGIHHGPT